MIHIYKVFKLPEVHVESNVDSDEEAGIESLSCCMGNCDSDLLLFSPITCKIVNVV